MLNGINPIEQVWQWLRQRHISTENLIAIKVLSMPVLSLGINLERTKKGSRQCAIGTGLS